MIGLSRMAETLLMSEHRQAPRQLQVLLVEDNPIDVMMAQEAFKESGIAATLIAVDDGVQAMEYLRQKIQYGAEYLPDFILLDLNLPKKSGHAVLAEIKDDPILKRTPVAVVSGSSDEWDVCESYDHHANCYILKPTFLDDYMQALRALDRFWFDVAQLPERSAALQRDTNPHPHRFKSDGNHH